MEKVQIEKIYETLGIKSSRLKSLEELEAYGIKVKEIKGYNNLTEENKKIFNNFILNYFNQLGMRTKLNFEAIQINYVEETDYVAEDPDDSECELFARRIIKAIYKDGKKKVIHKYGSQFNYRPRKSMVLKEKNLLQGSQDNFMSYGVPFRNSIIT